MQRLVLIAVIAIVLLLSLGGLRALGRAAGPAVADASAGYCVYGFPAQGLGVTYCTP